VVRSRIGLMVVAVAKALGAQPGILTEMGDDCMKITCPLGADYAVKINKEPTEYSSASDNRHVRRVPVREATAAARATRRAASRNATGRSDA
jgi:hypothetical protein